MTATVVEKYGIDGFVAPQRITSDAQNAHYTDVLYKMERRGNLSAAEEKYAELLTLLIESYEQVRFPIRAVSPLKVLNALVEANGLRNKDLMPQLGSEPMVSMILSGTRPLNTNQIRKLSKRFRVSADLFI